MTSNPCPKCGAEIAMAHINVAQGVGLCKACGSLSTLVDIADEQSDRVLEQIERDIALKSTPDGCSINELANERTIRVSLRSLANFFGSLAICLFWNGIVSFFVFVAISATMANLGWQAPSWMPLPIINGKPASSGMTIFLWLFLTPFIAVGLWLLLGVAISVAGTVTVVIRGVEGGVRIAVGPIGWTRSFDALKVKSVTLEVGRWHGNGESSEVIQINADRTLRFGLMIPAKRRRWLCAALHHELIRNRR